MTAQKGTAGLAVEISPPSGAWHALPAEEAMAAFDTPTAGLDEADVALRRQHYGPNALMAAKKRGPLMRFAAQFNNVLIYVLLAAVAVTLVLGHWIDAGVIAGVVLINGIVGFIQEGRAEQALEEIRNLLSPEARILRAGRRVTVPAAELVPGDIVFLSTGDRVPADLRLVEAHNLQIQEALLTGEAMPVEKCVAAVDEGAVLGDRLSMAFSGTLVTRGQGWGVAVATGQHTEVGRISALIAGIGPITTPLLRQIGQFGRWLTAVIVAAALVTFLAGVLLQGFGVADMFLAAVSLAVAAIPEELPAIMTVTLALGVQRMARRHAIVRHLPDVETLGSVTVICSDKTGTLTENVMTAVSVVSGEAEFHVSGAGYGPDGGIMCDETPVSLADYPVLAMLIRGGVLCNDAHVWFVAEDWQAEGDPTEAALVTLAMKAGAQAAAFDPSAVRAQWPRIDVLPFEAETRYMATLHRGPEGRRVAYVKGASERVLAMCQTQRGGAGDVPLDIDYWNRQMDRLAGRGQRVLAFAMRVFDDAPEVLREADVEADLIFLGLVGFADPPRREVPSAVAAARAAGIDVKMITGDHAATALAVARDIGLVNISDVLTGAEIDALDDEVLARRALDVDVFARTSPEHKLRLVEALQRAGAIVAMTGDGVNDAPALKRADVGVAMGRKGTDAAREAAGMVLADDHFATIVHAVEEGRTIHDNLRKSIAFMLPTHVGEALTVIVAVLFGQALPMTPVQILWVNMVTTVTLSLVFAFEAPESNVMKRPPRRPRAPILSHYLTWRVVLIGLLMVAGTLGMFLWQRGQGADLETARTVALHTLIGFELFYLFSARRLAGSPFSRAALVGAGPAFIAAGIVVALGLAITYVPVMQTLFQTRPLDAATWGLILAVSASVLLVAEADRLAFRWRRRLAPRPR